MAYPSAADVLHGTDAKLKWYPNEPSLGAAIPTPVGYVVDVRQESINEEIQRIDYPGIRRNKQPRRSRLGDRAVRGDMDLVANLELLGWVLQALLGPPDTVAAGSVRPAVFQGSGLDDLTSGGTFTGTVLTEYLVEIDGTGASDTFRWSKDGGATWVASNVAITGSAQNLDNGVTVTFGATTGHTVGDRWWILAHAQTGHLFTASGATPPSFKLERSWDSINRHVVYSGCRVGSLRLSVGSMWDGILTVGIVGRNQEGDASSPLDATPTELLAPWLAGPDLIVLKGGQQTYQVQSLDLTIDRGVDPRLYPAGGGGVVRSLPVGVLRVTGRIAVTYEDATWIQAARADQDFDLSLRLVDTASPANALDLRMMEVRLTPAEPGISDEDKVVEFDLEAHYESSPLQTMLRVALDNGVSSYAGP